MKIAPVMQTIAIAAVAAMLFVVPVAPSFAISYDDPIAEEPAASPEINDPLETVNRGIFSFNRFVDKVLLKPLAKIYRFAVPEMGRKGVGNVLQNLATPITVANSALQGDYKNTTTAFWRFVINSTIGIGGIFDVASEAGLQYRSEDLGQTFGHYEVGHGMYLMLPLLGPSSARDTVGLTGDFFMDPFYYVLSDEAKIARTVVSTIHTRERLLDPLDELEQLSFDLYATIRSLYVQRRANDVANGVKSITKVAPTL